MDGWKTIAVFSGKGLVSGANMLVSGRVVVFFGKVLGSRAHFGGMLTDFTGAWLKGGIVKSFFFGIFQEISNRTHWTDP